MWSPLIVSIIAMIVTIISLALLEKKGKIKQKTKLYKIIEIIGLEIPIIVTCVNYAYVKTDTLKETIIATIGILICIIFWVLFFAKWKTKKYNYIMFVIVSLCSYILINSINKYMLSNIYIGVYSSFLGSALGTSINNNKNKGRLIVSGVLVIAMIIIGPIYYQKYFVSNNKVKNISIEYVENMGYDITSDDEIIIFGSSTRSKPIHLHMVRRKSDKDWTATRYLDMVYFNGEIIEFSQEK